MTALWGMNRSERELGVANAPLPNWKAATWNETEGVARQARDKMKPPSKRSRDTGRGGVSSPTSTAQSSTTQQNTAILTRSRAARMETLPPAGEETEKQGCHSK